MTNFITRVNGRKVTASSMAELSHRLLAVLDDTEIDELGVYVTANAGDDLIDFDNLPAVEGSR